MLRRQTAVRDESIVLLLNIIKQMAGVRNVLSGDEAARQDSGLHPERTTHPYQFYNRLFT